MSPETAWLTGLFFSCAFAMPIPEDVALLSAGLLVLKGAASAPRVYLVAWSAIVVGDSAQFFLGKFFFAKLLDYRWARRILTGSKGEAIERKIKRWGPFACFGARFLPGARIPMYMGAGAFGANPAGFIALDSLAAAVSVGFWLFVGHHAGTTGQTVLTWLRHLA